MGSQVEKPNPVSIPETPQFVSHFSALKHTQESISDPGVIGSTLHIKPSVDLGSVKKEGSLGEVPRDILEKVLKVD